MRNFSSRSEEHSVYSSKVVTLCHEVSRLRILFWTKVYNFLDSFIIAEERTNQIYLPTTPNSSWTLRQ